MTLFELPAQYLSQSGGKYLAAGDLADWQWMFLANNLTLTKAFDLRRTLFPGNTDPFAERVQPSFGKRREASATTSLVPTLMTKP